MSKMTKAEIAKELLDPYFINPDLCSYVEQSGRGTCLYSGPGGRKCAFAAACVDGVVLAEGASCRVLLEYHGQEILKEKYRHVNESKFWGSVRAAHDCLAVGDPDTYTLYAELVGQEPPEREQGNV